MEFKEETSQIVLVNEEGNQIGEITWETLADGTMAINHTGVNSDYRGQNLARKLLDAAVAKARNEHKKISPVCPYVQKQFEKDDTFEDVWAK